MFASYPILDDLKTALIPVSEQLTTLKHTSTLLHSWAFWLPFILFILVLYVVFTWLQSHVSYGYNRSHMAEYMVVAAYTVLAVFYFAFTTMVDSDIKALSSHQPSTQPLVEYKQKYAISNQTKTIASLKSHESTQYGFLWSNANKNTTTYLDSHDTIETLTVTPKATNTTDRLTFFVVYKDKNKVILKSEAGEVAMSTKSYTWLKQP